MWLRTVYSVHSMTSVMMLFSLKSIRRANSVWRPFSCAASIDFTSSNEVRISVAERTSVMRISVSRALRWASRTISCGAVLASPCSIVRVSVLLCIRRTLESTYVLHQGNDILVFYPLDAVTRSRIVQRRPHTLRHAAEMPRMLRSVERIIVSGEAGLLEFDIHALHANADVRRLVGALRDVTLILQLGVEGTAGRVVATITHSGNSALEQPFVQVGKVDDRAGSLVRVRDEGIALAFVRVPLPLLFLFWLAGVLAVLGRREGVGSSEGGGAHGADLGHSGEVVSAPAVLHVIEVIMAVALLGGGPIA